MRLRYLYLGMILGLQCPVLSFAAVSMTVSIHRISDNAVDAEISWPAITLPAGWVVASHYIQIDSALTTAGDGIQIYTENMGPSANPKYTGPVDAVSAPPAGLIHTANTKLRIPTAWRISDLLIPNPQPISPIANSGESFLWFYHLDSAQVANNLGSSNFVPGDPYITMQNATCPGGLSVPCIHYAQSPAQFGAAASPNYVYLEADFTTAMAASTYRTNSLQIEAYSQ